MKKALLLLLMHVITIVIATAPGCAKAADESPEESGAEHPVASHQKSAPGHTGDTPGTPGSDAPIENRVSPTVLRTLSDFLDNAHMVPGISEGEWIDQMGQYRYRGEGLPDTVTVESYDGPGGYGCIGAGERYRFSHDYRFPDESGHAESSGAISTEVELDGLTLPCRIQLDDTLDEVCRKLGMDEDPLSGFVPDTDSEAEMTLYRDDRFTLVFVNRRHSGASAGASAPYELVYTECYVTTRVDGSEADVTRGIQLFFSEEGELVRFGMRVSERFYTTA